MSKPTPEQRRISELEQRVTALQWMLHVLTDMQATATLRVLHETLRLQLEHSSLVTRPVAKGTLVSFYAALEAELRSPRRNKRAARNTSGKRG